MALAQEHFNVKHGLNQFEWDGKSLVSRLQLPAGNYRLAAWVTKEGVRQYVLADQVLIVK